MNPSLVIEHNDRDVLMCHAGPLAICEWRGVTRPEHLARMTQIMQGVVQVHPGRAAWIAIAAPGAERPTGYVRDQLDIWIKHFDPLVNGAAMVIEGQNAFLNAGIALAQLLNMRRKTSIGSSVSAACARLAPLVGLPEFQVVALVAAARLNGPTTVRTLAPASWAEVRR